MQNYSTHCGGNMDINSQLSKFIQGLRYDDLPEEIILQTKRVLLDFAGCVLAGIPTPSGRVVNELSPRFPQERGATVLGLHRNISPFIAAMGNGCLANALDVDDGHRLAVGHPGGVVIPAALAAAEIRECSGKTLIEATLIGYEIAIRTGMAVNSDETYFGSAHWGAFGAAAAAAKILNLESGRDIHALGITEMHAPTCQVMGWIETKKIPMIKEGMGWGAATGYLSALMAQKGMGGSLTIFNEKEDVADLASLGSEFQAMKVYFKQYSACRWAHPALDGIHRILGKHRLNPDEVKSVRVKTTRKFCFLDLRTPKSIEEAQYGIPFLIGAAIAEGSVGPEQMSETKLKDERILELAQKVHLIFDEAAEKKFPRQTTATVEVDTRQGKTLSQVVEQVKGDWDYPFSDREMEEKFIRLSKAHLKADRIEEILNLIKIIAVNALVCCICNPRIFISSKT